MAFDKLAAYVERKVILAPTTRAAAPIEVDDELTAASQFSSI